MTFSRTLCKGFLLALSVMLLTAGTSYAGWHELPQTTRANQLTVGAFSYYPQYLGNQTYGGQNLGECKVFLKKVVHDVSTAAGSPVGTVDLPSNAPYPNDYYWGVNQGNSGNPYVVSYGALDPNYWQPGMIVQMRTKYANGTYGPHTAMVWTVYGGSITFIESNYTTTYTVDVRSVSRTAFYNQTENGNHFTVYEIH